MTQSIHEIFFKVEPSHHQPSIFIEAVFSECLFDQVIASVKIDDAFFTSYDGLCQVLDWCHSFLEVVYLLGDQWGSVFIEGGHPSEGLTHDCSTM